MAGLHEVVPEVLGVEEFFVVLINLFEVGIVDLCNVLWLGTNAAG